MNTDLLFMYPFICINISKHKFILMSLPSPILIQNNWVHSSPPISTICNFFLWQWEVWFSLSIILHTHKVVSADFWTFFFIVYIFLFLFYFFIVVQSQLSPFSPIPTHTTYPHLPHSISPPPLSLSMGPLYMFLDNTSSISPIMPLLPPLWSLSVCSLFQGPWFYFACLFLLLIRFHL